VNAFLKKRKRFLFGSYNIRLKDSHARGPLSEIVTVSNFMTNLSKFVFYFYIGCAILQSTRLSIIICVGLKLFRKAELFSIVISFLNK